MAKLRSVNTHFWDDTYIVNLDPIEKLLFLYFLTNPLANISGAYEISIRRIAFDTGIDSAMVTKVLTRFESADKMIYRDGWIFIVNFIKNQSLNPKITKGIEIAVKCCPDWIKDRLSIRYDSLSIDYDNPNLNLNLNSNPNSNAPRNASLGDGGFSTEKSEASFVRQNQQGRGKRPLTPGAAVNGDAQAELERWLDAVAQVTGAKSRHTIAKVRDWEDVCIQAITEHRELQTLIGIVKNEMIRLKDTPQFFSPKNILQTLQMNTAVAPVASTPKRKTAREYIAEAEAIAESERPK